MLRKTVLCALFFIFSPIILFSFLHFLPFIGSGRVLGENISSPSSTGNLYIALPQETGAVAYRITSSDSVPFLIESYLKRYKSPLLPFVSDIISSAKKHNIDPRLVVAIAQQESNLGKTSPDDCFNAWGWGIHAKGTKCYSSWPEAIESVTKGIAEGYCQKGYCEDPCIMMKKYTPRSNGSWCFGINQFLKEMQTGDF